MNFYAEFSLKIKGHQRKTICISYKRKISNSIDKAKIFDCKNQFLLHIPHKS